MARKFKMSIPKTGKAPKSGARGTGSTYIEGLDEVKELLTLLKETVPEMYFETLEKYGALISQKAIGKIKSKTENLVSSFKTQKRNNDRIKRVSVVAGGNKAPHAHLVEFGHRMISHEPEKKQIEPMWVNGVHFMRNAFEEVLPTMTAELDRIIDDIAD